MAAPDYLICLNCETPCYSFEWQEGGVSEALCLACATDDPDDFITEEALEALSSGSSH